MKISEYMRLARIKAGLAQTDVTSKFKWSSGQYLSNFERDKSTMAPEHVARMCRMYGADADEALNLLVSNANEKITKNFNKGLKNGSNPKTKKTN